MFKEVPAGGDVYVLSRVIHDWDDDRAVEPLANFRRTMRPLSKLILAEEVLPPSDVPSSTCWYHRVDRSGPRPNTAHFIMQLDST